MQKVDEAKGGGTQCESYLDAAFPPIVRNFAHELKRKILM